MSWNTAAVADGSYDLRVVTTDNAGLTFTSAIRHGATSTATPPTVTHHLPDSPQYGASAWNAGCSAAGGDGLRYRGRRALGTVQSVTVTHPTLERQPLLERERRAPTHDASGLDQLGAST